MQRLPIVLAILLYVLVFFLRWQQVFNLSEPEQWPHNRGFETQTKRGGWEMKLDLFPQIRQTLDQKISQFLPSPQAELLSGILLGQNKNLPGQLKLALRDTSTLHIVVASGQNLSMVAGFFLSLAGLIKRSNALILSLLAVILYTLLTGFQVPILRAAIMFSFASVASFSGRAKESRWILIITAALMLLINPKWITDLSFQLSFLATFGVVVIAPILLEWLKNVPIIGQDLAVSLAAQAMVMPVIAQNFHQLSAVGIIANVFILWTIPFIMIGGTAMLILGFILGSASSLIGVGVNILLTYFIYIVHFFASLPFAWEYVGEQVWAVWVGYYLILAGAFMGMSKLKTQKF